MIRFQALNEFNKVIW